MDWLLNNGEMGRCIRNKDWSQTPLGAINSWPQSLKIAVNLCLNSNFPICIAWGKDHHLIYNDGYRMICGKKHPQSLGHKFKECWADAWPIIGDYFEEAFRGNPRYLENQRVFIDRNGYLEETFFTFSYSPICDDDGNVLGIFHPVTETTEKMLSERRNKFLREFSSITSEALTINELVELTIKCLAKHTLDTPFSFLYFFNKENQAELQTANINNTEISHADLEKVIDLNQWPFNEIKNDKIIELDNFDQRFTDITYLPYAETIKTALLIPINSPVQKGAIIVGISTRRQLDNDYRMFYEMLQTTVTHSITKAGAYEHEKKRAEELAELDRAKTIFFNNVSHEFRTPLTLMLGPLEDILLKNEISTELKSTLGMAQRNCIRLLKLVNTLLDFSRIESQRMETTFEPVDLSAFTIDLASNFRSAIEQAKITYNVECEKIDKPICVDKEMWEKIVLNLLSNSFKYTLKGNITLSLKLNKNKIELKVTDSGIGIPKEELNKIFERFYRVKSIQGRTHEGTGIGLSLVKELVKLHDGEIIAHSESGVGSSFTVSIPADIKATHEINLTQKSDLKYSKAIVNESLSMASEINNSANKKEIDKGKTDRIIIAEDNADMRDYISHLLSDLYQLEIYSNGKDALDAAIANPPCLILSDIMMPIMDGIELVKEVRKTKKLNETPIILISARAGQESLVAGIDTGADDYLVKPFSAKEILARVRQHTQMFRLRQETVKQKKEFLSHITHDLRAPLNAIIGFTSLLFNEKTGSLSADQKEYLGHVLTSSNHLLQLINDLLDLAKAEAGKIDFRPELIDLGQLVDGVLKIFKPMASEKNIQIKMKIECNNLTANLDPLRLKQVLYNYLSNAIKFTKKDGLITVAIAADAENMIRIDVKDNGIGIHANDIDKLFIDFQQLQTNYKNRQGTGLGLALTKKIIEAQHGRVEVKSQIGKGSVFSAILPRNILKPEDTHLSDSN